MKAFALHVVTTTLIVAASLLAYDSLVVKPAVRVGVVDLASVYRAREAAFAAEITKNGTEDGRNLALDRARKFAERLTVVLDELPRDCACIVMLKSAVAGGGGNLMDLTPLLQRKLGAT